MIYKRKTEKETVHLLMNHRGFIDEDSPIKEFSKIIIFAS